MARLLSLTLVVLAMVSLTGCAGINGYYQPSGLFPAGGIYTETTSGGLILENGVTATKEGRACGSYILVVGTGDTSIETAMKSGGIKKAVFITQHIKTILGPIYGEICTVVRGN